MCADSLFQGFPQNPIADQTGCITEVNFEDPKLGIPLSAPIHANPHRHRVGVGRSAFDNSLRALIWGRAPSHVSRPESSWRPLAPAKPAQSASTWTSHLTCRPGFPKTAVAARRQRPASRLSASSSSRLRPASPLRPLFQSKLYPLKIYATASSHRSSSNGSLLANPPSLVPACLTMRALWITDSGGTALLACLLYTISRRSTRAPTLCRESCWLRRPHVANGTSRHCDAFEFRV